MPQSRKELARLLPEDPAERLNLRTGPRSGRRGSNPRPSAWEADALPTELRPRWERSLAESERATFARAEPQARSLDAAARGRDRSLSGLLHGRLHAAPAGRAALAVLPRRQPAGRRLPPLAPAREEPLQGRGRHRQQGRLRDLRR